MDATLLEDDEPHAAPRGATGVGAELRAFFQAWGLALWMVPLCY